MSEVTRILDAVQQGDPKASDELLPLVYEELRKLSAQKMAHEAPGQTLQPTALVHEAWLRMLGSESQQWQNRAHFFAAAAQAMRRILIERARAKARIKRGGRQKRLDIHELDPAATTPDEKCVLVNEALTQLETVDPEKARIVELKFFGGLTNNEVAEVLGVTERTVERHWAYAKAWLYREIRQQL